MAKNHSQRKDPVLKRMSSRPGSPERIPTGIVPETKSRGIASNLLLWFIIITLIAWFLLYVINPTVVQKVGVDGRPTGEVDIGKTLLGGLLIGLVFTLIIWLLRACR